MSTIGVISFVQAIRAWAVNSEDRFKFNWPVKGGWEGWIQVDLTAFVLADDSTVEILREQPVYTNTRQRCDLLLNATSMPEQQIIVEIKAESFHNWQNFITGVVDDLAKLDTQVETIYQKSVRVMLAIPFNPPSHEQLMAIEMGGHQIFGDVFVGQGDVACAVAIRTADGWLKPEQVADESPAKAVG